MSVRTGSPSAPGEFTLNNFAAVYGSPQTYPTLINTALYAIGVTVVSLVIAAGFAWLTERTDMPGRSFAWVIVLIPIAMPGMLASMAWILLLAPNIGIINVFLRDLLSVVGIQMETGPFNIYSLAGMIFVEGVRGASILFLMLVGAFRLMDPSLEEAAEVAGSSRLNSLRRVTIPILAPALMAAGVYGLIGNLDDFETPLLIGLPAGIFLLPTIIYFSAYISPVPNWGIASAYTTIFLVIMVVLVIWYYRFVLKRAKRFATVSGKGYRPTRTSLGRWRWPAAGLFGLFFLTSVGLPILVLIWASLLPFYELPSMEALQSIGLQNYADLFGQDQIVRAATNTLLLGVATATLTMLLAFFLSWAIVRLRVRGSVALDSLAFVPHAIPGVVMALGLLMFYLHPAVRWIGIYGTMTLLIIAMASRYIAFGTRLSNGAITQVGAELEEAAWAAGASRFTSLRRVTIPLILPMFLAGWLVIVGQAFRSLTIPFLLGTPRTETLSVRLFDMWSRQGDFAGSAALGMTLMVTLGVISFIGRKSISKGFGAE
jgi:iron(III) transport system permease protein